MKAYFILISVNYSNILSSGKKVTFSIENVYHKNNYHSFIFCYTTIEWENLNTPDAFFPQHSDE